MSVRVAVQTCPYPRQLRAAPTNPDSPEHPDADAGYVHNSSVFLVDVIFREIKDSFVLFQKAVFFSGDFLQILGIIFQSIDIALQNLVFFFQLGYFMFQFFSF